MSHLHRLWIAAALLAPFAGPGCDGGTEVKLKEAPAVTPPPPQDFKPAEKGKPGPPAGTSGGGMRTNPGADS